MPPTPLKWTRHKDLTIERGAPIHREEYLDHMTFRSNRRPLFTEIFGPLIGLKEEWEAQGATEDELSFRAFRYRNAEFHPVRVHTNYFGGAPEKLVEESEHIRITRDRMGRLMKLSKGTSTLPLPMTYPVKTMEDWLRVKPHFEFTPERLAGDWEAMALQAREEGKVITACMPGGYDLPRQLMGEENLSYALYDEPEMIHDMLDSIGDMLVRLWGKVAERVQIDRLFVHEDMAGSQGPMMGPAHVRTFLTPYYRRIWEPLQARGARIFDQDSDGDMRVLIPELLEAGINSMYPMEPAAGMDIVEIRKTYGKQLALTGGLDKHVLRKSRADILRELERKIPPMRESGGCVLALDHRIPNGTPLENYRFYIRTIWEMLA